MSGAEADFATQAVRLAGLSGALLGWRPDEFWRATPAELATIFAALLPDQAATRVDRTTLLALLKEFPDG